jgi:hypothetical protein
VMAVQVFPIPLILLVMGAFYLWVYASHSSASALPTGSGSPGQTPVAPSLLEFPHALKRSFRSMISSLYAESDAVRGPQ